MLKLLTAKAIAGYRPYGTLCMSGAPFMSVDAEHCVTDNKQSDYPKTTTIEEHAALQGFLKIGGLFRFC